MPSIMHNAFFIALLYDNIPSAIFIKKNLQTPQTTQTVMSLYELAFGEETEQQNRIHFTRQRSGIWQCYFVTDSVYNFEQ